MDERLDSLTATIITAAIAVHRALGPGLFESAYEACLAAELIGSGLNIECQKALPLSYKGRSVGVGYRLDILVEQLVVVEIKSVERLEKVHSAQPWRIFGSSVVK